MTPTRGMRVQYLRTIYIAKVLSWICYAAPAWFNCRRDCSFDDGKCEYGPISCNCSFTTGCKECRGKKKCRKCNEDFIEAWKWSITQTQIKRLDVIQRSCLVKILGGLPTTPYECVLQQSNIEPIEICMDRRVRSYIGQQYSHSIMDFMRQRRSPSHRYPSHPYHARDFEIKPLYDELRRLNHRNFEQKRIQDVAASQAFGKCLRRWREYCETFVGKKRKDKPAVWDDFWDKEAFRCYRGLDRAQSTLLFQCKTGHIGLNKYLFDHKVRYVPCPRKLEKQANLMSYSLALQTGAGADESRKRWSTSSYAAGSWTRRGRT